MARPAAPEGTAPGLSVMNAKEGIIYEDPFKTDTVRCGCHAGLRSARRLRRRGLLVHGFLGKPGDEAAEVAAATGLTDQSHLTRAFTRRYGITPVRYQKQVTRR